MYSGIIVLEKLMVHNNPHIDLVCDSVIMRIKIWLNSQTIEQKTNSDVNQGS